MDFASEKKTAILLVDNGSLRPEATLSLRRIAAGVSERIGRAVEPVSILHSNCIPAEKLDGQPAEVFAEVLAKRCASGVRDFAILPLFFGPSGAINSFIPEKSAELSARFPDLRVQVAEPLVAVDRGDDCRVARILGDHVAEVSPDESEESGDAVVLVDHGSPLREVVAVRDHVAKQLAAILNRPECKVLPASMERRPGAEYDFNEPLLETLLQELAQKEPGSTVTIAMMFFSPGRHAGPGGDIEEICRNVESQFDGFRTRRTRLVAEHPLLVEILADRFGELAADAGSV